MATPHNNVRRHSKRTSPIKRAPLLGVLHLQLLLSILVATSNYCNFGSYSRDHEYGGGQQQSSFKLFVECFSSPPPISSTSSRLSSFSHQRATLKGSSFHNRHQQQQQQTLHRADSIKSSSVRLHGTTSNSAEVNTSSATIPNTKKAYKKKRSTKKQSNNYSQKKYSKQKGAAAGGGGSIPKHMMNAARQYNSQLTKCNSVSELLSSFMEQTSTSTSTSSTNGGDNTSSATHLAGANKLNSVNFSTCLHRLARFAAKGSYSSTPSTSNMNQNDARKQVLSDPRFALLVCSMAEMASGVDASTSVKMGNEMVLQKWRVKYQE